jgi:phosphoglycolate phosphatase
MRPTVLLYDVDGTLITTGGAARLALEEGIAVFLGIDVFEASFSFGGMTDRGIMRGALKQAGVDASESEIDDVIALYLERLPAVLSGAARFSVHDGVVSLLDRTRSDPGYAVGLGTGNVERGARLKLDAVGLNPYLGFGGFGCDAESRPELILAGARRGAAALGRPLDECRVVIIGDTERERIRMRRGQHRRCLERTAARHRLGVGRRVADRADCHRSHPAWRRGSVTGGLCPEGAYLVAAATASGNSTSRISS